VLTEARKRQIENEAIRLRQEIWEERASYWPGRHPHPLEVLDPQIATNHLGYELHFVPELSLPYSDRETAGLLDRNSKRVVVADCYGPQVRRFTAAHELGHIVLGHEDRNHILHRDMPIVGLEQQPADPVEREANFFAGCFLMPPKFLTKVFRSMFGAAPLVFDHAAATFLSPRDPGALLHLPEGSLGRYRALASAGSYAYRPFKTSLAGMFQVSVATMAIRLREIGLVEKSPQG
jgi:hypothetical protein